VTTDEYKAPVVAAWQAGSGRVLCYTGEADGQYAGGVANWPNAGDFFASLARWTAGEANNLPGNLLLTQEVKNGVSVIKLHLDPETLGKEQAAPLNELPKVTTLRGTLGAKPASEKAELHWTAADTLEAALPLQGNETMLSTVEVQGYGRVTLAPVTLPYSPEFKPVEAEAGPAALARLAQTTGGKERLDLAGIWRDLPRRARLIELAPWLLLAAAALLLLEVLERHTGLVTQHAAPLWERAGAWAPEIKREKARPLKSPPVAAPVIQQPANVAQEKDAESAQPAEPAAILAALRQARQQAKEKTER
jgi:hypothetical protein